MSDGSDKYGIGRASEAFAFLVFMVLLMMLLAPDRMVRIIQAFK